MVDPYGNWTYVPGEPESMWNSMDCVAHWIESLGYTPQTSMENLVVVLMLHFENFCEDMHMDYPCFDDLVRQIALYVEEAGPLSEFDYEP